MCDSNNTLLDSSNFSFPLLSQSQNNSSTSVLKSYNNENDFLELSHPPLSKFEFDYFSPDSSWNEVTSFDSEFQEQNSDLPSQLSELSLETSPSLRSVHLPTNHRVSTLYYGMQLIHNLSLSPKKQITSSVYSERAQKFIILDHAGIIAWYPESNQLERVYLYSPYKHNLFLQVSFSVKYNVYFVLTKARNIITFNSQFAEVNSTRCIENSLLHLLFLDTKSTLIGAGVNGVSFWAYKRVDLKNNSTRNRSLKPTENYILYPSGMTEIPDNKLIRKVTISHEKKWIFALSFYDVYVISFDGKLLKSFLNLHKQTITDCLYNTHYCFLLTVSTDSTLILWSDCGFQIHEFNSAMKSNTAVIQHPLSPHLVIVATVKGFIKCYNLFTLEEEFTQYIMECPILKMDCFQMSKQIVFYAIATQSISLFNLNYFCQFWGPLRNTLTSICFYRGGEKSERFHALCRDGTIRIYSIAESRPLSVVLPPPDITFPTSAGSVGYDRNANLLYILLGPKEIWVYTTKTNPACRLEVYSSDVMSSILRPRDLETGMFVATGVSSHTFIPHCTCVHILSALVSFPGQDGSQCVNDGNLLMIGLKDGRIIFVTTKHSFFKLFEMQASVGEVVSLRYLESYQIISQSVSVGGFIIKIWSLPGLTLEHSLELHSSLVHFWKVQDILLAGFSDGRLSLSSLKGMGSSFGGGSEVEERDKNDEIVSIHGIDRFNLFCTAQKSGVVKIWDHHKNLIKVIDLNGSVNGAYFLNTKGDLLVCFNQHLYWIKQEYVLSSVSLIQAADTSHVDATALTDSAIFEDPNCKTGQLVATKHGFSYVDTMESYLKPYDIDLQGPSGLAILDQLLQQNVPNSATSSLNQSSVENLATLTSQVYISATQTPLVLSFEHFPLPIFSSPTVSLRGTPPPSEINEKEVIRTKLASLNKSDLQNPLTISPKSNVVERIEPKKHDIFTPNDPMIPISQPEEQPSILTAIIPNFDNKLVPVRKVFKLDTFNKGILENPPDISKHEVKQMPSSSVPIQANRIVKTRVLRGQRMEKHPEGQSEILANMDGVNYVSLEGERSVVMATVGIPPIEDRDQSRPIREVRIRGITGEISSSIRRVDKQLSLSTTTTVRRDNISNKMVELSQEEHSPVQTVDAGLCRPSIDDQGIAEIRHTRNRIFAMDKYVDFSPGWQEREYIRRLSYRVKQYERCIKVWTYQASLRTSASVGNFNFESNSRLHLHQYRSLSHSDCIAMIKSREGIYHNQSKCSTPFQSTPIHPPSTPVTNASRTHSSSSFYSYKRNLDVQTNFRLSNKQVCELHVRVPPNSRCTSAPPISTPQCKRVLGLANY